MVPILEDFDGYTPPEWVKPTVARLLDSMAETQIGGLAAVVLTESARTKKIRFRRKRGKKRQTYVRLGFYTHAWRGEPPSVRLIIDNILSQRQPPWIQMGRDFVLAEVLFHEIGHHLNARVGLIAASEEASAEAWKFRLLRLHWRKRYPFVFMIVRLVSRVRQRRRRG